jgi:hypothetical protein
MIICWWMPSSVEAESLRVSSYLTGLCSAGILSPRRKRVTAESLAIFSYRTSPVLSVSRSYRHIPLSIPVRVRGRVSTGPGRKDGLKKERESASGRRLGAASRGAQRRRR